MKVNTIKMKKKLAALGMCLVVGMANFAAPVSEIGDQFLSTGCISASAASVSSALQEKQTSAKNKNLLLNDSNRLTRVGNYGCAMFSNYYMAIQTGLLSPETSVKEFLTRLKKVGAFDREGYITSWTKITKVIPEITYNKKISLSGKSRSAAIREITKQLKNGKKCIVQVSTKYGNHYVYCYTSGSSVKIADSSFSYGSLNNSAYTTIKAVLIYDVKGGKKVVDNTKVRYYKACSAHYNSLVDGLKSIGVDSSFAFRSKIAAVNNISEYRGRADQNTLLLRLLQKGRLRAV